MEQLLKKKITLEDMYLFELLAGIGSISGVANRTGLTQPAITQKLNRLENELGTLLWVRRGRLIGEPTEGGRRFLQYSRAVLRETTEMLIDIGILSREKVIHIAASSIPSEFLLPRLMAEFHDSHQSQEMRMTLAGSRQVCAMVENGVVDVGFAGFVMPGYSGKSLSVAEDWIVPVVSNTSPIALEKRTVSLKELMSNPLILREDESGTRAVLEEALESHGFSIPVIQKVYVVGGAHAILQAVREGTGFSFVSSLTASDLYIPEITDFPKIRRHFYMLYQNDFVADTVVNDFITIAKKYFSAEQF